MTERRFRLPAPVLGFDRAAAAYERGRPGYPPAAVAALVRALGIGPRRTVVELASGTGKFTRALRPSGAAIVAVEPVAGMRAEFARAVPGVLVVPGTAEAIPLPDGCADAVVVAQAFHWFRARPAVREIARVVRPGGGVGLVWNTRVGRSGLARYLSTVADRYRGGTPRARADRWRAAFATLRGPFYRMHHRSFLQVQRLAPAAVVDRIVSISYIASLPGAERRSVAARVLARARADPEARRTGRVTLPYRTDVYWARRR